LENAMTVQHGVEAIVINIRSKIHNWMPRVVPHSMDRGQAKNINSMAAYMLNSDSTKVAP